VKAPDRNRFIVGLAALLSLTGCLGFTRVAPSAQSWRDGVRTVGLLSAISIHEVHPGGVVELQEEWTAAGAKNVMAALSDGLRQRGLPTKVLSWKGDPELDEMRLLYGEVASAIFDYTMYPYPFPTKSRKFDYQVGSIEKILQRSGTDVLLIAAGRDDVGANGRSMGIAGGQSSAFLSLGLIDRAGKVTWFDVWAERGMDLRREADARRMVERMLANMPGQPRVAQR
jgi:hypothetical protein